VDVANMPLSTGETLGPYQILGQIGAGAINEQNRCC